MEKLLVFIPAYNCEKQLPRVLDQLLDKWVVPWVGECIVVNNRSTDGTEAAALAWMNAHPDAPVTLLRNDRNYGLGGSHKVAFGYAAAHGYGHLVVLHGDDQGDIRDLLPILETGAYKKYDCCLGSRFMPGSRIQGYSALRIFGNLCFNVLYTVVAGRVIFDLGSGLNLYAVSALDEEVYKKFPDTLYFNPCLMLAHCMLGYSVHFFPVSWREEDQVSNANLFNLSSNLLKICWQYLHSRRTFVQREWRTDRIDNYTSTVLKSNLP